MQSYNARELPDGGSTVTLVDFNPTAASDDSLYIAVSVALQQFMLFQISPNVLKALVAPDLQAIAKTFNLKLTIYSDFAESSCDGLNAINIFQDSNGRFMNIFYVNDTIIFDKFASQLEYYK